MSKQNPVPAKFTATLQRTDDSGRMFVSPLPVEFSETRGLFVRGSAKQSILALPFDVLGNGECESLRVVLPPSFRSFFGRVYVTNSWWIRVAS